MKHFETKFASTDFKAYFKNLKKNKKINLKKKRFFLKLIRNFNLPYLINNSDLLVCGKIEKYFLF